MIRAVLFDVDGVLVHPWRWRDRLVQDYGITPTMTAPFFTGPFGDCLAGRADLLEVLPPFLAAWGWRGSAEAFVEQWCVTEHAPDLAVLDVVAGLRRRGVPCYVASTQERHRAEYLRTTMGFADHFDDLFFSCHVGSEKPHRRFYLALAERLGRPASELLFFDDVPKNVEGARACGWFAETFVSVDRLRRQLADHLGGAIDAG